MPARKPTALKIIEGQRGHRTKAELSRQDREPKPNPVRPACPKFLNRRARAIWNDLAPKLETVGVLTVVDASVLAGYCAAYEEAQRLGAFLDQHGLVTEAPSGYLQQRPEVSIRNRAWDRVAKFGAELGIGAASRGRIELKTPEEGEDVLSQIIAASQAEAAARRAKAHR